MFDNSKILTDNRGSNVRHKKRSPNRSRRI